jgi:hypothetical protein
LLLKWVHRENTAEMFRVDAVQRPSAVLKPIPEVMKKNPGSRSSSRVSFVPDSEVSGVEDESHGHDPLAAFYEEARAQKEDQVGLFMLWKSGAELLVFVDPSE